MKKIAIIFFLLIIFNCTKDSKIEKVTGTKLISIEYDDGNESWIKNFYYSSNDELIKIENSYSLGRRHVIEYQNSRLKEYSTYEISDGKLIFRDSIIYNSNGTISAIYHFSINSGENLPLSTIYEYEYDNDNKVSKKSTYFVSIQKYISIEKYYWKGSNINRVEYYNGDKVLNYEYFYEYDDKINYNKEIPTNISDPVNWGENNVTVMNWIDYIGNLDIICRPCLSKYKYNLKNYPVSIEFNWGLIMQLNYE